MASTRAPSAAYDRASSAETVVFPTPPFPTIPSFNAGPFLVI